MPRGKKLSEQAVADIKEMRKNGVRVKDIADKYNITVLTVYKLLRDTPQPKKEQRYCKYCNNKIGGGEMCATCGSKLKLVRELLDLGKVIRECAEKEKKAV